MQFAPAVFQIPGARSEDDFSVTVSILSAPPPPSPRDSRGLGRRSCVKGRGAFNLLLPGKAILTVQLGHHRGIRGAVQKYGPHDEFVGTHDVLVVERVRGAVGAIGAVDRVAFRWKRWLVVVRGNQDENVVWRRGDARKWEKWNWNGELPESPL